MKKILILTEHFAPAYKAGGIVRSLENLVRNFGTNFQFSVLTGNTDLGETQSMPGITENAWTPYSGTSQVLYLSGENRQVKKIAEILGASQPHVVYINGVYSLPFVIFPLRAARKIRPKPLIVVAPRGMLQQGALSVKPLKKKIYFRLFKAWGLHKEIRWHATDPQEVKDITRMFRGAEVVLANDTPDLVAQPLQPIEKKQQRLKLVTISLITAKKGHLALLETLQALHTEIAVEYHIYGPIKDAAYWEACQQQIERLSSTVQVVYHGNIHPSEVTATLRQYHFFVLPSKGENFGHAIYESLNAGRPVIISDQTPWKNLQAQQAGWDINLKDSQALPEALRQAYQMDQATFDTYCKGAQAVAQRFVKESDFAEQYERLFSK